MHRSPTTGERARHTALTATFFGERRRGEAPGGENHVSKCVCRHRNSKHRPKGVLVLVVSKHHKARRALYSAFSSLGPFLEKNPKGPISSCISLSLSLVRARARARAREASRLANSSKEALSEFFSLVYGIHCGGHFRRDGRRARPCCPSTYGRGKIPKWIFQGIRTILTLGPETAERERERAPGIPFFLFL